eukprot:jgi/Bigna1/74928/fgenesh1_pg.31_\
MKKLKAFLYIQQLIKKAPLSRPFPLPVGNKLSFAYELVPERTGEKREAERRTRTEHQPTTDRKAILRSRKITTRVLNAIGPALRASGFDIIWPFPVGLYNKTVVAGNPTRLTPLPTFSAGDNTLALLLGNSKSLWPKFHRAYIRNKAIQNCPSPLDLGYVQPALTKIFHRLLSIKLPSLEARLDLRFAHETDPNRLVAFAQLAQETGLAQLCPSTKLSVHPLLGPWLSYRAIAILDMECCSQEESNHVATFRELDGFESLLWGWSPSGEIFATAAVSACNFADQMELQEDSSWQWGKPALMLYGPEAISKLKSKIDKVVAVGISGGTDTNGSRDSEGKSALSRNSKAWYVQNMKSYLTFSRISD